MAATTTYPQTTSHFSPSSSLPSTPSAASLTSPRLSIDVARSRNDPDANMADTSDAKTPTNLSGIPGQRPLPNAPFSPARIVGTPDTERSDTDRDDAKGDSRQDVEMGEDGDQEDSDNDNGSVTSDSQRNKKKKKGQRFFCTDYPPCNLSFTRSEHLARHVRKHTGERPFQCHCGRRFSRLDNLRQHAQTVHVNEEIPGDSLAATGTRFQRQIRTDRVRAPGGRSRAGTASGPSGHARGHSRNLSASSIASNTSNLSPLPDDRRRPPPLAMSHDGPRRMPETYAMPHGGQYPYYHPTQQSPTAFSPPSSATYSHGPSSPGYSGHSPTLSHGTPYYPPAPSARRLSVPAAMTSFQAYPGYPGGGHPAGPHHSSAASVSSIASSRASVYAHSRRESDAVESDWRRRTWHPSTYQRPATSGLIYQQTPDDARPTTASHPAASQVTRLPGIESFDHAVGAAPPRPTSPMRIDEAGRPVTYAGPSDTRAPGPDDRRSNSVWEASLHQNLNRLDIASNTPPRAAPAAGHSRPALPSFSFPQAPAAPQESIARATPRPLSGHDSVATANRRQGWYGGPLNRSQPISILDRASPAESISSDGVPTPSTSHGTEAHPAILRHEHSHGSVLSEEQRMIMHHSDGEKSGPARSDSASHLYGHERAPSHAYQLHNGYDSRRYPAPQPQSTSGMGRLEALVAVATSENAHR